MEKQKKKISYDMNNKLLMWLLNEMANHLIVLWNCVYNCMSIVSVFAFLFWLDKASYSYKIN